MIHNGFRDAILKIIETFKKKRGTVSFESGLTKDVSTLGG
jgi:hypothetical protein